MKIKDGVYLKEYDDGEFYIYVVCKGNVKHSQTIIDSNMFDFPYGVNGRLDDLLPTEDTLITYLGNL